MLQSFLPRQLASAHQGHLPFSLHTPILLAQKAWEIGSPLIKLGPMPCEALQVMTSILNCLCKNVFGFTAHNQKSIKDNLAGILNSSTVFKLNCLWPNPWSKFH